MTSTMLSPPVTERRSSNPIEWINSVCADFTTATDWKLSFWELDQHSHAAGAEHEWCWHTDVSDGLQRYGTVFLEAPADDGPRLTFTSAYRLAELFATQINRYLQLQRTVQQQSSEIGALVGHSSDVTGNEFERRLRALLRASVTLTNFRSAGLFVLEPDGTGARLRFTHQIPFSGVPTPTRQFADNAPDLDVLQSGQTVVIRGETDRDADWLPRDASVGVGVAVENEAGPIGTLWLYDRRKHEVDEKEFALLRGFGRQIADTFERLVLLQDSATKERLTRELDVIANSVAECSDTSFHRPGCDIALRCCSHHEVGGDWCEVLPLDEHRTLFVVGDASGDSIPGAVVMSVTRGALHALLTEHSAKLPPLDEVAQVLNGAVARVTAAHHFMSLVLGIFDSRTRSFQYTNAGHPPPLIMRQDMTIPLRSLGLILGVMDTASYGVETVQLEPDDVVLLFTDGIIEARDQDQKMFCKDGVVAAFEGVSFDNARQAFDTIWKRFEEHTGGANHDDRTLLVMKVL